MIISGLLNLKESEKAILIIGYISCLKVEINILTMFIIIF
jgi:hypothetical protein